MGKVVNPKGKLVISGARWDEMDDDTPYVSLEEDPPATKATQARENLELSTTTSIGGHSRG